MTLRPLSLGSCLMLSLSCSSNSTTAPPAPAAGAAPSGGEAHHHAAHPLPAGPLADIHAAVMPLAHGEPGAERDARVCGQVASIRQQTGAIAGMPVPAEAQAHADAWRARTALTREADALVTECASSSRAGVADRLEALHVAFHDLTAHLQP